MARAQRRIADDPCRSYALEGSGARNSLNVDMDVASRDAIDGTGSPAKSWVPAGMSVATGLSSRPLGGAELTEQACLGVQSAKDRGYGRWSNQRNGDDWTAYDRPMFGVLARL
jgi:hypothetical protein